MIRLGHRGDARVRRNAPGHRVVESAVAISQQVRPFQPNPKISKAVRHQTEHAFTVQQSRHIPDKMEVQAVETNQTGLSADPEIAVVGLGDRVDGSAREPLLRSPSLADVLRHRPVGIDRIGRAGKRRGEPQHESRRRQGRKQDPAFSSSPVKGGIRTSQ